MSTTPCLWPPPRVVHARGPEVLLQPRVVWDAPVELDPVVELANRRLARVGVESGGPAAVPVEVRVERALATPREAYALEIGARGIRVRLASARAAHAACATLVQVLAGLERTPHGLPTPELRIADRPDFSARGALLDVSRTRVPRMESLYALVERLSALKLNQLQLYTEHAFAYAGHEEVWREASPFTPEEVRALDRFCLARGIELVPNQQSFGHMHRWLKHARYRQLAEVPEGVEHAFSREREPYSLDLADPRALALLDDLYGQLLPCFTSTQFNVGCDETFDLGLGRSRELCARLGVERAYLERLEAVHAKVAERGRRMQFWGDIVVRRPDLVPLVPPDAVALLWGYDAGHPFAEHAAEFARSGLAFYVCPGTSSWQSVGGRSTNLLQNLSEAARAGRDAGAEGFLVTEWGDRGYLQPRVVSEVGLALAAGPAWNAASALHDRALAARILDEIVFEDDAREIGSLLLDLGRAGEISRARSTNGTALFFLLAFAPEPFPHPRIEGLTEAGLAAAREHLSDLRTRLARVRSRREDARRIVDEIALAIDLLAFACDLGRARLGVAPGSRIGAIDARTRSRLSAQLAPLVAEHRRTWMERDRPGGLPESAGWLERIGAELAGRS